MAELSHTDAEGSARMVDVGDKEPTRRSAEAVVVVHMNAEAFVVLSEHRTAKGDALTVAKLAGIQAAKRTAELIPLCHQLPLEFVDLTFTLFKNTHTLEIRSHVVCFARTGVEMEALTACSVAALTVYDMLKAVQRDIVIGDLMLLTKKGGRSGDYVRTHP